MNQRQAKPQRWVPAPLLLASAALHLGAGIAVVVRPRDWPWALGAVLANHAVLTAAGLWPKSQLLGPNWTRLPARSGGRAEVAITIDDGPDPQVTPQVLSQLGAYGARASFFCVGERVEQYRDIAQEIIRRGHTIENHSQRHRHTFSLLGPGALNSEVARAQDSITRVTGLSPCFFRAPAGLRNPFLEPVLCRLQLRLATWTHRCFDTVSGNADAVLHGTILKQNVAPLTYNSATQQSSSFVITIVASVTLTARDGRLLYENKNYVYREQYQSSTDLPTFIQEDPAAIQRLSREFARQLVADVLEGL